LAVAADIDIYFAHPALPVRTRHKREHRPVATGALPQGAAIPNDPDHLQAVADEPNDRPRRILGRRTPNEVFAELLTSEFAFIG
jgi:transposase, IS30 family